MARHEPGAMIGYPELTVDKGLKRGALGLIASIVIGVASTAPAYSLAASLGFVVATQNGDGIVGVKAPAIMLLAFVPMFLIAIAYQQLNSAEPDCGTTFTWASRAFGPRAGWMGGWGIIAADVIVMANLAQIAGSYTFQLLGMDSAGGEHLLEHDRRRDLDHHHDLHLLPRDRGVRADAVRAAGHRAGDPRRLLGDRPPAGLHRQRARGIRHAEPVVVVALRADAGLDGDGHAHRRVHLLGLGHCRLGQRGER